MGRVKQVTVTQVDGVQVEKIAHDEKSGVTLVTAPDGKAYVIQGRRVLVECRVRPRGLFKAPDVEGVSR